MSAPTDHESHEPLAADASAEEIVADIERTRGELGDTVDALSQKLDLKAQAGQQVQAARAGATEKLHQARDAGTEALGRVREVATDDDGAPTPVAGAIAAAVVALLVGVLVWRRRR